MNPNCSLTTSSPLTGIFSPCATRPQTMADKPSTPDHIQQFGRERLNTPWGTFREIARCICGLALCRGIYIQPCVPQSRSDESHLLCSPSPPPHHPPPIHSQLFLIPHASSRTSSFGSAERELLLSEDRKKDREKDRGRGRFATAAVVGQTRAYRVAIGAFPVADFQQ